MKQYKDTPYYVTENGDVYRKWKVGFRKLNGHLNKITGYKQMLLCINSKPFNYLTHRLVAETYIPNPNNLPEVDHLDCNKTNNHVSNLEWVTKKENHDRAIKNGLKASRERHGSSKLNKEQIEWIRNNYKPYDKIYGRFAMAQKLNVTPQLIGYILKNKIWKI